GSLLTIEPPQTKRARCGGRTRWGRIGGRGICSAEPESFGTPPRYPAAHVAIQHLSLGARCDSAALLDTVSPGAARIERPPGRRYRARSSKGVRMEFEVTLRIAVRADFDAAAALGDAVKKA